MKTLKVYVALFGFSSAILAADNTEPFNYNQVGNPITPLLNFLDCSGMIDLYGRLNREQGRVQTHQIDFPASTAVFQGNGNDMNSRLQEIINNFVANAFVKKDIDDSKWTKTDLEDAFKFIAPSLKAFKAAGAEQQINDINLTGMSYADARIAIYDKLESINHKAYTYLIPKDDGQAAQIIRNLMEFYIDTTIAHHIGHVFAVRAQMK